jgi:ABC-type antimicrobial peptide transport system permease subunit
VLDEPTAKKLFPNQDPMGQIIRYDNAMDLTVSGVIKQMPVNSAFQMQMIMSYETLTKYMGHYGDDDHWGGGDSWFHGYVLLQRGANKIEVEQQLTELSRAQGDKSDFDRFELSPLTESHFDTLTDVFNYAVPRWIMQLFVGVAVFLVVIACINFINLSTAQAVQRSREIGLRKVIGGSRSSVVFQFFAETFMLVSVSVLFGTLLTTQLLLHADSFFVTKVDEINVWDSEALIYILGLVFLVTVLAGFYPAIILSGFSPMRAFRNMFSARAERGVSLRRSLVVLQFVIAQVLVICMVIGIRQINFFYNTNHGFVSDHILTTNMAFKDSVLLRERFEQELLQHPEIKEVTFSLSQPASNRNWWWGQVEGSAILSEGKTFRLQWVDNNFFEFYEIQLVAGRNFVATDTLPVALVNEEALRIANIRNPEDILGQELSYWNKNNKVKVIGVVKDYYSQSLKSKIVPHLYMNAGWNFQLAQIKVDPSYQAQAVEVVEKTWKAIHPDNYFEYEFLHDTLGEFYDNEKKFSNFIQLFSIAGLLIGCLGLYGLVSFVCIKRTKEISIRKVLGATLANILKILSTELLILLSIAITIAIPLGWFMMNQFLQHYAYRVEIQWNVFLTAASLTLLVALLTITFRTVKTALINPAENLKSE